jgi:ABC-2 type transport system permease protein
MRGWYAVFRKEAANFFVSPIAYVLIASFLLLTGFFFWLNMAVMSEYSLRATNNPMVAGRINLTDFVVRPLLANMGIVLLFVTPLITMRLFSEEKKSGTIELLLTYPITDLGVMAGKFMAAALVILVMLAGTFAIPLILFSFGPPDMGTLLTGYLGLLLLGAAFASLGMFISTLTENQIISAAVSFGAALIFWVLSWASAFVDEKTGTVMRQMSILEHLNSFLKGIISVSDLSFFVMFTAFFLFLSLRSLETHRWRG